MSSRLSRERSAPSLLSAQPLLPQRIISPNAWLWNNDTLSDVTIVLRDQTSQQDDMTSTASAALSNACDSLEQPFKKVCRPACSCQLLQSQPGPPDAEGNPSELQLTAVPPTSSPIQPQLQACFASLKLHAVVLSSASGFFRTLFSKSTTINMGARGWCPQCKISTQILEGRELEAAEQVFKFIYTHELPTSDGLVADKMLLVWMIQVADRWDVPTCIAACKTALCALSHARFPTSGMFDLPSTFCSNTTIDELVVEAGTRLLAKYGDAPAVMRDAAKLKKFNQLPQQGVSALLKNDLLRTDAEGTVLLLLHHWYTSNKQICSNDQLYELRACVRYSQLTVLYTCSALPHFPRGFQLTHAEKNELWMVSTVLKGRSMEDLQEIGAIVDCPKGWFLAERPSSSKTTTLQLKIPQAQLLSHVEAVAGMRAGGVPPKDIESEKVFGFGYDWLLSLASDSCESALALCVEAHSPFGEDAEMIVKFSAKVDGANVHGANIIVSTSNGSEWSDVLDNADVVLGGDCSLVPWAKHMVDGHLCFSAKITIHGKTS